jgi:hypothetical protein
MGQLNGLQPVERQHHRVDVRGRDGARVEVLGAHLGAALVAVALSGAVVACGGDASEGATAACSLESPTQWARTNPGDIEQVAETTRSVGFAVRDASATLVGFCLPSGRLPAHLPTIRSDGETLRGAGGMLVQTPRGWTNWVLYPPTRDRHVDVLAPGHRVATVEFPPLPRSRRCPRSSSPQVLIVACETYYVLEWRTRLQVDAERVLIANVRITESRPRGRPLGFHLHKLANSPPGLTMRFAIAEPSASRLHLIVHDLEGVKARLPYTEVIQLRPH